MDTRPLFPPTTWPGYEARAESGIRGYFRALNVYICGDGKTRPLATTVFPLIIKYTGVTGWS